MDQNISATPGGRGPEVFPEQFTSCGIGKTAQRRLGSMCPLPPHHGHLNQSLAESDLMNMSSHGISYTNYLMNQDFLLQLGESLHL